MKKITFGLVATAVMALSWSGVASAHVVVQPKEVETAAFQTFTTGVPNEKESSVTNVRLVIPAGLKHVAPTVKPGWTIATLKDGEGEEAIIKEITWSGGSIPAGQRDDFTFSAQAPVDPTSLQWKAYQTYEDGETVNWDQAPTSEDREDVTPYSITKVVEKLAATSLAEDKQSSDSGNMRTSIAIGLSVVAVLLSAYALTRSPRLTL